MRGCHDPAGVRAVGRRETRIDVLLSQRSLDSDPRKRATALPVSGLIRTIATRSKDRPNADEGRWAFSARAKTEPARINSSQPLEPCIDPLYLFVCALSWGRYSNSNAGWELVRCLRTSGQTAHIAAALLAHADNKPGCTPLPAINDPGKPSQRSAAGSPAPARRWL
jgi:hypothetical protein